MGKPKADDDEHSRKEWKQLVIVEGKFGGRSFGDNPPGIVSMTPYISSPVQPEQMAQMRISSYEGFIWIYSPVSPISLFASRRAGSKPLSAFPEEAE